MLVSPRSNSNLHSPQLRLLDNMLPRFHSWRVKMFVLAIDWRSVRRSHQRHWRCDSMACERWKGLRWLKIFGDKARFRYTISSTRIRGKDQNLGVFIRSRVRAWEKGLACADLQQHKSSHSIPLMWFRLSFSNWPELFVGRSFEQRLSVPNPRLL